jgi:uncharacterized damage-inducible protein DinB
VVRSRQYRRRRPDRRSGQLEPRQRPAFRRPARNNDETFDNFNPAQWADLQKKLDQVMTDWETAVQGADDQKVAANASLIAHVVAHNAYHLGQILYVRKLEGAWDPSKGVK